MIDKENFMPLNFFKKADYYGSLSGLRYRIGKAEAPYTDEERAAREAEGKPVGDEERRTVLRATIWEGPFSYGKHDAGTEYHADFPFDGDGIGMAVDWINGEYTGKEEYWQQVPFWTPKMSRDWETRQDAL